MISLIHLAPQAVSAFLASLVEFVEALTVILAVGSVRGWKPALEGTALGLAALFLMVALLGSALTVVPLRLLQFVVGLLLLLFGMRWLRKAILRSAGIIPLHDETKVFAEETNRLSQGPVSTARDWLAIGTACKIVLLEGSEVVFIVIALGSAGGHWLAAGAGAGLALLAVALLGLAIHRPLAKIPENPLKFTVGIFLSTFGCFWTAEGIGLAWPGEDWSLLVLLAGFTLAGLLAVRLARVPQ